MFLSKIPLQSDPRVLVPCGGVLIATIAIWFTIPPDCEKLATCRFNYSRFVGDSAVRIQFILQLSAQAILALSWCVNPCGAQDQKPADPQPAKPQPAQPLPAAPNASAAVPAAPAADAIRAGIALPAVRLLPAMARTARPGDLPFDLSSLVLAKFDESAKGPQIVALVEQTRTEQKTVAVTKLTQEIRTRKVKVLDQNGKESEVEQQYTVSVPVTENVERAVRVPAGKKPTAFPFDELRIYRLDGTKLSEAEARTQLEKMSPVFLLRGFTGEIKPLEGVYLQALNPNCLIVVTEKAE